MSQWPAEQQITALKYGAYTALASCVMFGIGLLETMLTAVTGKSYMLLSVSSGLSVLAFLVIVARWSLKHRGHGDLRQILQPYTKEFAQDLIHKASSFTCFVVLMMLLFTYVLAKPDSLNKLDASMQAILSLSNFSLLLMLIAGVVWASTILLNLREEAED